MKQLWSRKWHSQSSVGATLSPVAATGPCSVFGTGLMRLGLGFNCIIINLNSVINAVVSIFGYVNLLLHLKFNET